MAVSIPRLMWALVIGWIGYLVALLLLLDIIPIREDGLGVPIEMTVIFSLLFILFFIWRPCRRGRWRESCVLFSRTICSIFATVFHVGICLRSGTSVAGFHHLPVVAATGLGQAQAPM